jgi:hypothetical protein
VIIAGSCGSIITPAIFAWSGQVSDAPRIISTFAVNGLNVEGVMPVYEGGILSLSKIQVLTDNGTDIFYGDTIMAKNLPVDNLKRFSSIIMESAKQVAWPATANIHLALPGKQ